jgi:hypothetical protein
MTDLEYKELLHERKKYLAKQEYWLITNNIKVGDKVKVLRAAKSHENGWSCSWVIYMDEYIGKELEVVAINSASNAGIVLGKEPDPPFIYPYFVLEPVKEKVKTRKEYNKTMNLKEIRKFFSKK